MAAAIGTIAAVAVATEATAMSARPDGVVLPDRPPTASLERPTTAPLLDVCPIDGDHDLHDSWGWPRSGGRRHQGVDVAAATGTELYAVRDGVIDVKQTNLGGNSIWLVTDDGDRFFYAHLSAFEGDDRRVEAGDLIGYVGSTGNAGGAHLHFETHPDGEAENPFPHVLEACTEPEPAVPAIDVFLDQLVRERAALATRLGERPGSISTGTRPV